VVWEDRLREIGEISINISNDDRSTNILLDSTNFAIKSLGFIVQLLELADSQNK